MKGAKIGTLFLISIIALAGVGASYATWEQTADIGVTATTGILDFAIREIVVVDPDGAIINPVKIDDHTWTLTISNTYPGWMGYINIRTRNIGTIDMKYYSFQVLSLSGPSALRNGYTMKFYPPGNPVPPANIYGTLQEFTTMQYYELDPWFVPAAAITFVPGEDHWSLVSLELAPGITGNQNTPVTFTFRWWVTQA